MKTHPIEPASLVASSHAAGVAEAPTHRVLQDAAAPPAFDRAHRVFLSLSGLPGRWGDRERFVVLDTRFGTGVRFLATWAAWQDDPRRCDRLVFVSIEPHPLRQDDLRRALESCPHPALADRLAQSWPALTHNLHPVDFEDGRVRLLLAFGDPASWVPELNATVDAFYLERYAPSGPRNADQPPWDRRALRSLARLAAPGATGVACDDDPLLRAGLVDGGFEVSAHAEEGAGPLTTARYRPPFTPRREGARLMHAVPASLSHTALVIGAGLAGSAVAHALARRGWACTVLDRRDAPAQETSGNAAGLFHGVVTPEDGAHARFNRAAALMAARTFGPMLREGRAVGAIDGLLRLSPLETVERLAHLAARVGLPADYVQPLDGHEASQRAGVPVAGAAWWYPQGGWMAPPTVVSDRLRGSRFVGGVEVGRLQRQDDGTWVAIDTAGREVARASVAVVAQGPSALRLLGRSDWPVTRVRGQVSVLQSGGWSPRCPVAGNGYAIELGEGKLLCGATQQPGDDDPAVRDSDHVWNLQQLQRLSGRSFDLAQVQAGRVGWRMVADDRLPLLGPVPVPPAAGQRQDRPRFVAREPGLFCLLALGSRGLTWAPLAADLVAAWITGDPLPMEGGLIDAVDAARFDSRAARRS